MTFEASSHNNNNMRVSEVFVCITLKDKWAGEFEEQGSMEALEYRN
jgi:hypothetical protein